MNELSQEDFLSLLSASPGEERTRTLARVILDLMMELEALREVVIRDCKETQDPSLSARYRQTYRDTAYLTHDATGPTNGMMKLLDRFYRFTGSGEDRNWRETLMMRRLGFSDAELARYKVDAVGAEMFT